ncbi:hypothetical protein DLEV_157 [Diachasmimorpha longicaudata entomopoxvirus]|uniref:Uncharacterized protein n=1 Tax=Diachasmimorpha longicaudata entomopoxvirus TaxID=109981 RepID=A0A7R5WS67_9POXV|nr:hypothetical protein QKK69_gp157 [Diachasmimorpha longicaudata entomopoxvirus]AKS26448.1 hypothetical protein DLEV_157 [Diachasmimorpha longicaudata entomopoxvirus]
MSSNNPDNSNLMKILAIVGQLTRNLLFDEKALEDYVLKILETPNNEYYHDIKDMWDIRQKNIDFWEAIGMTENNRKVLSIYNHNLTLTQIQLYILEKQNYHLKKVIALTVTK